MIHMELFKKIIQCSFLLFFFLGFSQDAKAVISFQDDTFATTDSIKLIVDYDDTVSSTNDVTLRFGATLNKTLLWNRTLSRFVFSDSVGVTNQLAVSGRMLIGSTTAPANVALDINGNLSFSKSSLTALVGNNNNYNVGNTSFVYITSAPGNFILTGIDVDAVTTNLNPDGHFLFIHNGTNRNMTLSNNNAASAANNRIYTMTGGNQATTGNSLACFFYDVTQAKWILTSVVS